jgi:hypothetical protein
VSRDYWASVVAGDWSAATAIIATHDWPLFHHLGALRGGLDAAMHAMFEIYGLAGRHRRAPYPDLTDAELENLREFCASRGWSPP